MIEPGSSSVDDVIAWGLDRQQAFHYYSRLARYYDARAAHHRREAVRYGRLATRWAIVSMVLVLLALAGLVVEQVTQ